MGAAVYRYFKYLDSGGARATLAGRTLRWSRPSRFNDLFDMAVPYSTDVRSEYVTSLTLERMWARVQGLENRPAANKMGETLELLRPNFLRLTREQFDDAMRPGIEELLTKHPERMRLFGMEMIEHLKTIKVLCLSRIHDDNTMWGLYAENHRGVVLEFANVDGIDSVYSVARPVTYSDQAPPLLDDDALADYIAGNIALTPRLADPLMLLKSNHWRYEQELRIVSGEGREPGSEFEDVPFHPRELFAVYFGARSQNLRTELEPLLAAKYPHTQRWQSSQGKAFQIDFCRVD